MVIAIKPLSKYAEQGQKPRHIHLTLIRWLDRCSSGFMSCIMWLSGLDNWELW